MIDSDVVDRQLRLAWRAFSPDPGLRARVHAKLAPGAQAPLPLGAAPGNVPKTSRIEALRASGKLGAGVGAGLFGLGVLMGLAVPRAPLREPEPSTARPAQVGAVAHSVEPQPAIAPPPIMGAPMPAPAASDGRQPPKPVARHSTAQRRESERDWRGELALLERAEKAVRADSSAFALALLAEFDARYPRSRLSEERQAIELMAHCRARATDAPARAERFRRAHPRSVYAQRIAEVCVSSPSERTDKAEGGGH